MDGVGVRCAAFDAARHTNPINPIPKALLLHRQRDLLLVRLHFLGDFLRRDLFAGEEKTVFDLFDFEDDLILRSARLVKGDPAKIYRYVSEQSESRSMSFAISSSPRPSQSRSSGGRVCGLHRSAFAERRVRFLMREDCFKRRSANARPKSLKEMPR